MMMNNSPNNPGVGIWLKDSATLPEGNFIWVEILKFVTNSQLVSTNFAFDPYPSANNQLDGIYPYPSPQNNVTSDAPGRPLYSGFGEAAEKFDAIMYVLWDSAIPVAGQSSCTAAWVDTSTTPYYTAHASNCSSIPVPLGSIEWKWSACAINSGAGASPSWFRYCGPGKLLAATPSDYPKWSSCYVSSNADCN